MNDKFKRVIKAFLTHSAAFGAGVTFDRWLQHVTQKKRPAGDEGVRQLIEELREGTGCTPEELIEGMRQTREMEELVRELRDAGVSTKQMSVFVDVMQMMIKEFTPLGNAMTVAIGVYIAFLSLVHPDAAIPTFQEIKTSSHNNFMNVFARQWRRKENEWLKPFFEFVALLLSLSVAQSIHRPASIPTSATPEEEKLIRAMAERIGHGMSKLALSSGGQEAEIRTSATPENLSEGLEILVAHWQEEGKPALHCDTLRHIFKGMKRAIDEYR